MSKKKNNEDFYMDSENEQISMIAEISTEVEDEATLKMEYDKEISVLPLRNMVMFPHVVMPITIGRASSLKLVNTAFRKKQPIALVCQLKADTEEPGYQDLYHVGVIARVLRVFEMPGGNTTAIMQSAGPKVHLDSIVRTLPYLKGMVTPMEEEEVDEHSDEFNALMESCKELSNKYIEKSDRLGPDTAFAIKNLDHPTIFVNFVCANFPFTPEEKVQLLRYNNLKDRMYRLIQILNREVRLAEIKHAIQVRTREDIDRQQRDYFLHQQIKNIQEELGDGQDSEIDELRGKGLRMNWPKEVADTFEKELAKLERINPQAPDYSVQLTYLQTMLALPWGIYTEDNLSITHAEKTLNKAHYGLEKVKERILEHLAVLKLKGDMKSPIVCLYGPPGVG